MESPANAPQEALAGVIGTCEAASAYDVPLWSWPLLVPAASSAFVYYDDSAYPPNMDVCMQTHLPACFQKTDGAFRQCADTVFARCQQNSLGIIAAFHPYLVP